MALEISGRTKILAGVVVLVAAGGGAGWFFYDDIMAMIDPPPAKVASAVNKAAAHARASGKPGVLLTHLGPGLTNAATGVANAALDSIPMVVIAGDVPSYFYGRHPHQEVRVRQRLPIRLREGDRLGVVAHFLKQLQHRDAVLKRRGPYLNAHVHPLRQWLPNHACGPATTGPWAS